MFGFTADGCYLVYGSTSPQPCGGSVITGPGKEAVYDMARRLRAYTSLPLATS